MIPENYLNEIEINEIQKFNENTTLKNAVKKVFLAGVYAEGVLIKGNDIKPTENFMLQKAMIALQQAPGITNEQLGQDVRANTQAIRLIELGFQELDSFKVVQGKKEINKNPGR